MKAAVQPSLEPGVFQEAAMVIRDEPLTLQSMGVEFKAERAASCLLKPKVGDEVLAAHLPDRRVYVLAVLTREGKSTELEADGDLRIRAASGRVDLQASQGIGIGTPEDVSIASARVNIKTVAGAWLSDTLTVVVKSLASELEKAHVKSGVLDSVVGRFTQKAKRVVRMVEETDILRAERLDYAAQKSVVIQGENAVVTAKQLIKVDGDQIHLG